MPSPPSASHEDPCVFVLLGVVREIRCISTLLVALCSGLLLDILINNFRGNFTVTENRPVSKFALPRKSDIGYEHLAKNIDVASQKGYANIVYAKLLTPGRELRQLRSLERQAERES